MGLVGAGVGASQALEQILAKQMVDAQMRQRQAQEQQRIGLEQARLSAAEQQQGIQNQRQARLDDEHAADRRAQDNTVGMRRMIGEALVQRRGPMTPDDLRDITAMQVEAGETPNLSALVEKPPARDPVADYEAKKRIDLKYREPKAAPERPDQIFVMRNGQVTPITKGTAQLGDEPITPAGYQTVQEKKAAQERQNAGQQQYRDDLLNVVDELLDAKAGVLKPATAGVVGSVEGRIPEGMYFDENKQKALAAINRLQSLLDLQKLGEMKAQSRTGASGFGQLSEKELAVLEAAASTLRNRKQGDVAYADELKRVRNELSRGRHGSVNNPDVQVNPAGLPQGGDEIDALINRLRKPKG